MSVSKSTKKYSITQFGLEEIPAVIKELQAIWDQNQVQPPSPSPTPVPTAGMPIEISQLASRVIIDGDQNIPPGAVWVSGNQPGSANTYFSGDELVCELHDTANKQSGARVFLTNSGRWDVISAAQPPLLNRVIRFTYEANLDNIPVNFGDGYFATAGIEIKPDSTRPAAVQVNVERVNGVMRYWLGGDGGIVVRADDMPAIPVNQWHWVVLDVLMGQNGWAKLTYGGKSLLMNSVSTTLAGGWTGIAWCLYSNGIKDNGLYAARFRNLQMFLMP